MNTIALESDVALAMEGDDTAYRRIVDRTAGTVCSIALAIVRDVAASEDVAQEVFLAAWTGMRKLRNPSSFLPWLRQIARNHSYLWIRKHRHESPDDAALASAVDSRPRADQLLLAEEERRLLETILDDLPEETREIVLLYYREDGSARHVAELLGIREEAVRQRLSRARARIREEMLERFGRVARQSAPGAAFLAGVGGLLTAAAPSTAVAATLATAAGAKGPLSIGLLAALKGASLGALTGIGGVLLGMKRLEPFFDEKERGELMRLRNHAMVAVTAVSATAALGLRLDPVPPRFGMLLPLTFFFAVLWYLYRVRLPKILERRIEWEIANDPVAATQQRRELIASAVGRAVGAVCFGIMLMFQLLRFFRQG